MEYSSEEAWTLADEALDYTMDAHERIDYLEIRCARLEKALAMVLDGHNYGAKTVMGLDEEAFE